MTEEEKYERAKKNIIEGRGQIQDWFIVHEYEWANQPDSVTYICYSVN